MARPIWRGHLRLALVPALSLFTTRGMTGLASASISSIRIQGNPAPTAALRSDEAE
jgi:hypothetical protein